MNPKLLAFILGGKIEEIESALAYLCAPDPESRSKAEDGRRMVKEGEYQYRIVNWLHYQSLKRSEDLRAYNARMQSEHRERERQKKMKRGKPLKGEDAYIKALEAGADEKTLATMAEPKRKHPKALD